MNAAAFQHLGGARGSGGNALFGLPPATFRFSACVSLRLPQASLGDCKQSLSLVARKRPEPKAPSVIRFADATSLPEGGLFTPCGCTTASKRTRAAILERIASAECDCSSDPLQPEPPSYAAAFQRLGSARGSGGNALFGIPPGGFPPLSTRESGLVPQASLGDCMQSLSLVMLCMTFVSTRESGLSVRCPLITKGTAAFSFCSSPILRSAKEIIPFRTARAYPSNTRRTRSPRSARGRRRRSSTHGGNPPAHAHWTCGTR